MTIAVALVAAIISASFAATTYVVTYYATDRTRYQLAAGIWTIGCGVVLGVAGTWIALMLAALVIVAGLWRIVVALRVPGIAPDCRI